MWNGSGWQCADQPAYSNGTGLNLNGNTFSVKPQYQLPQGCASGQLAGSDGAGGWGCQNDKSYTGSDFAVSNQGCPGGQFASAVDSAGKLSCAAPPTNAPIHGYFQDGGIQNGDYPTSVGGSGADLLSRQVPSSGFYMVFANASLGNVDGDSQPADCGIEVSNNGNTSTLADTWIDLNSKQVSGNLVTGTTLTAAASVAPVNYGGYLAQGSIVTLHCHSFNAYAMDQSLSLISVNAMN